MRSSRAVIGMAVLLHAACGGDGSSVEEAVQPLESKLSSIQRHVFDDTCTLGACHAAEEPSLGLDLTAGASYDALVGVEAATADGGLLVAPGLPGESFLVRKLRGDLDEEQGAPMPLGYPPLDEEAVGAIESWIAAGAADD